jgi:hypothetical protein
LLLSGNGRLLNACGILTAEQTPNVTIISAQTFAATLSPTDTPLAISLTPTITESPYPFTTMMGLRGVYISGGDVYIQDGGEQPVQLTHSGQASRPVLISDDGQKIAFACGAGRWCVVNADGTGERALVTPEQLASFGEVYSRECLEYYNPGFVPGSHQLLFFTQVRCEGGEGHIQRNNDLWLADTDTSKLRQLRAPGQGGIFWLRRTENGSRSKRSTTLMLSTCRGNSFTATW